METSLAAIMHGMPVLGRDDGGYCGVLRHDWWDLKLPRRHREWQMFSEWLAEHPIITNPEALHHA